MVDKQNTDQITCSACGREIDKLPEGSEEMVVPVDKAMRGATHDFETGVTVTLSAVTSYYCGKCRTSVAVHEHFERVKHTANRSQNARLN